jgi:hypothetical protein
MTEFLEFTSVVTYRVPIKADGTPGIPEILKKWTTETRAPKKKKIVKKVSQPKPLTSEVEETVYF